MEIIERLLQEKWSPEQISGSLNLGGLMSISHETIHKYIWWDKCHGGVLHKYLRQYSNKRRKRYKAYYSRGLLAGKRHISERPDVVEKHSRIGDWEIDTMMGSGDKHCIVTLVERRTVYTLIGKLNNRTKEELNQAVVKMIRSHRGKMITITADNGTEFHGYSDVEKATEVAFYFATAYRSWERGTNANTNGLIRQYLPKRKSMAKLTQNECNQIAYDLNTRPRKRLQFNTPWNIFRGEQNVALQC
jgi:transposase, IS30 family